MSPAVVHQNNVVHAATIAITAAAPAEVYAVENEVRDADILIVPSSQPTK